jgi:cell division protein FtsB
MPSSKPKESKQLHLTISLAEVVKLQTDNAALKKQVADLEAERDEIKRQLHALTDPAKQAAAAAFKKSRGYK